VELRTMRTIGSVKEKAARKRDDEDNDLDLGSLAGWGGEIGLPIMSVMTNSNSLVLHWAPRKPPLHLYTLRPCSGPKLYFSHLGKACVWHQPNSADM
jgi:hypothetical protein